MELSPILFQLETERLIRTLEEIEPTFSFNHALTQDAAYSSLLKSKRADLHGRVARTIEAEYPHARDEIAAVLALHFARAGDDAKAFEYAARAGDAAKRTFSHDEALAFYAQALEYATHLEGAPDVAARVRAIYSQRGNVLEVMGVHTRAIENYRAMIEHARRLNDLPMEAAGVSHLLTVQGTLGDVPDADAQLARARELAQKLNDPELIARAEWNVGLAVRFSNPKRAVAYHLDALQIARAANLRELTGFCLLDLANEMQMSGDWRGANERGREALESFRALDNQPMLANALGSRAIILHGRGEAEAGRAAAEEGSRISHAIENPWGEGYNEWTLMAIEIDAGEFARAFARAQRAIEATAFLGISLFNGLTDLWLARAHLELNQLERAEEISARGARTVTAMGAPIWNTLGSGIWARVLVRRGKLAEARALLDQLPRGEEAKTNLWGFTLAGPALVELALAEARYDDARETTDWLVGLFEQEEMLGGAADLLFLRGQTDIARNDLENAERDLLRARELAATAAKQVLLWRVDAARALNCTRGAATPSARRKRVTRPSRGRARSRRRSKNRKCAHRFWSK